MSSKNRRIFSVLAILQLFNSLVYSGKIKIKDNALKKDELMNQKNSVAFQKDKLNNQSNVSKKNSNISLSDILFKAGGATLLAAPALIEWVYILNQRGHIEDIKKQLDEANKSIEERDKKIENMKPSAFSLLGQKYTFYLQLSSGRRGSTAIFYDKDSRYVVVKTLFKSGDNACLKEIEKEREAVEFFKDKPKNEHMVFPLECFEDNHFLFVIYPFVSYAKVNSGFRAPCTLNNFKNVLSNPNIKPNYETWNNITKKKCLWNLTKQWFEIYKYFYQNGFYHGDISSNILIQVNKKLEKNMKLNYDDFIIKIIDWGIWEKINCNQEFWITDFKKNYKERLRTHLFGLYKDFKFEIKPHKNNSGHGCSSQFCCAHAFFAELDELIGATKDSHICSSIYKTVGHEHAKTFDELIDFCQQQINKLS